MHAVREDPKRRGLLYAGTEIGVFISFDHGAHWQPLQLNLPNSPVHDLVVKDDDLVVGTHGRSFWVLDDLTPLRQITAASAGKPVLLYEPQTALRLHYPDEVNKREPGGDNPPAGAIIDYYFKTAPKDEVVLEVLDSNGKLVRRLSSVEKNKTKQPPEWPDRVEENEKIPAKAGMNRYAWNLRYESPLEVPGAFYGDSGPRGPLVLPGEYQVRLTVAGESQTARLSVAFDPRVRVAQADLQKQFDLSKQIAGRIDQLHRAINEIRDLKSQVADLHKRAPDNAKQSMLAVAEQFNSNLSAIEEQLIQVNMKSSEGSLFFPTMLNEAFDSFSQVIDQSDREPTQAQYEVFQALSARLDDQLQKWAQLKENELPKVNDLVKRSNLPMLSASEDRPAIESK